MQLSENFYTGRRLETLVENQTSYTVQSAELHIFETHQKAEQVVLQFDQPILASMIQGKKIMHLKDHQAFDFLPGESLILPSNELMCIDFPEAGMETPTRCSAMAISQDKIREVVNVMNETIPRIDGREWEFMDFNYRFTNDIGIYQIIQRLFFLFTENHPNKDTFVDFMLKELIIRVLRSNYQQYISDGVLVQSDDNRIIGVIRYIRENLNRPLSISELSRKAYMSESNFHRVFKNEVGMSPIDFINNERIKLATSLLKEPGMKIKEVYARCGFDSRSYFNRVFKRKKKVSPGEYKTALISGVP